jgi:hypothetical protein
MIEAMITAQVASPPSSARAAIRSLARQLPSQPLFDGITAAAQERLKDVPDFVGDDLSRHRRQAARLDLLHAIIEDHDVGLGTAKHKPTREATDRAT